MSHPIEVWEQSQKERAEKDALAKEMLKALKSVIEWDKSRNFPIPYRVRDPIHSVIARAEGKV